LLWQCDRSHKWGKQYHHEEAGDVLSQPMTCSHHSLRADVPSSQSAKI
jgi:hypothetical protein